MSDSISTGEAQARAFFNNTDHAAPAGHETPAAGNQVAEEVRARAFFPSMRAPEVRTPPDAVPATVAELRAADAARQMYTPQKTYADIIVEPENATPDEKANLAEWREVCADVEIGPQDAQELVEVAQGLTERPTPETRESWRVEAMAELQRTYGRDGVTGALADANKLIERDPRLRNFLEVSGLGNHPRYVLAAVRLARSQMSRGRLR